MSSTTSRILSGSLGSWARMVVSFATQLLFVPVYLSYWSPETYGTWLALTAAFGMYKMIDFGFTEYLGFEFLKIGKNNRPTMASRLWSGIRVAVILSLVQLTAIGFAVYFNLLGFFFGEIYTDGVNLSADLGLIFLLLYLAWVLNGYIGGIFQRSLYAFGYFPRINWWGFAYHLVTALGLVIAVIMGAGILEAGITVVVVDVIFTLVYFADLVSLMKNEKIWFRKSLKLTKSIKGFIKSFFISGKSLLEQFQQQGVRVILAPLTGGVGVAAFTTMRTGANVVLQGLGTITNPLMPELMRFLNRKDQERTEVSFSTVWLLIMLFAPAVVVLQIFIEPLYNIWVRNSMSFNPLLFALLSFSVLIYGLYQPAIAVVKGNNILKPQITISALSALFLITGMYFLVPQYGILGAGLALSGAELISLCGYIFVTNRWLEKENMKWPSDQFKKVVLSVCFSGLAMGLIVWFPNYQFFTLCIFLPFLLWNIIRYWMSLPNLATVHLKRIIDKLSIL